MLPGPDLIIECPECRAVAKVSTLVSYNTFGATAWTDGKVVAPGLPQQPALTKCRCCGHYFWVRDAKVVGEIGPGGDSADEVPDAWKNAESVKGLDERAYLEAIGAGVARDKEQEVALRIYAWWAGNDPVRGEGESGGLQPSVPVRSPAATANLERLFGLLDEQDPSEQLMKAELARELGRFDEAMQLLDCDFPGEYAQAADFIRRLAREKDAAVREIPL